MAGSARTSPIGLHVTPAQFHVLVTRRPEYACHRRSRAVERALGALACYGRRAADRAADGAVHRFEFGERLRFCR